jgi:leader peptidase (prepilin peptidase) / N-methyltransferase
MPLEPVLALVAAPFIGSMLGTLVLRLPEGEPVVLARSACEHCGHALTPRELIPVISWALQGGRCRHCHSSLSYFYPGIEIAALAVALWAAAVTHGSVFIVSCFLGWLLLALAIMDLRTYRLHDALVIVLAALGAGATWLLAPDQFWTHALAGLAGVATLFLVALAYRGFRGRDGLGLGDAKLFGAAGLWVGWNGLASVLLIASLAALCAALVQRLRGREMRADSVLPFGPFLSLALWLVWLYGPIERSGAVW